MSLQIAGKEHRLFLLMSCQCSTSSSPLDPLPLVTLSFSLSLAMKLLFSALCNTQSPFFFFSLYYIVLISLDHH